MKNRFTRAVAICLPLILGGGMSFAATIKGTVRDTSGLPLPGVTVEVAAPSRPSILSITDQKGEYRAVVPAGTYQVTFQLINFSGLRRTTTVAGDQQASIDVALPLEASASIVVTGKQTFRNLADLDTPVNGLIGIADAASVGVITAKQVEARTAQRPGDVLESVPGVIISQHSGEGKANQYYLRGFNLDHGTDFASTVAGAPVNMPTHAHGQGYSDNNFLIPELVSGIQYKKGPYYADEGDFSTAGAVNVNYVNFLERPVVSLTAGSFGYQRLFSAGSKPWADGQLLGALELSHNNGPWVQGDNYRKYNGFLRYTGGSGSQAYSITGAAYDGKWNSTDQIPQRGVDRGLISKFGEIDKTDGAKSHRYSLVGDWQRSSGTALTRSRAYVISYGLNMFSNFTYFLDDPVNGDQFQQVDRRIVVGGRTTQQWFSNVFGHSTENLAGIDVRHDHIGEVALFHTMQRARLETIRSDKVLQTSAGLFFQTTTQWRDRLRSVLGVRGDGYQFSVHASDPVNGGRAHAALLSPKGSLIFGPFGSTEFYVSAGSGFHSNDGRGSTLTRDPKTGQAVDRVTPIVRTRGAEVGVRTTAIPRLQSTLALWGLDIASELIFSGDAGSTDAGRASRRSGFEWSNYYHLSDHLVLDADLAYSKSRFTQFDPVGDRIPGAVGGVVSSGISAYDLGRFDGSIRYRYLGPRTLIEDNSVRSRASNLVQANLGFAITPQYRFVIEGLNLLNAQVADIDYYYTSRLLGEPLDGVNDIHTHPVEPRAIRVRFEASF